jgi:hypothetical protein
MGLEVIKHMGASGPTKLKIKLSLYLIKHNAMKTYGGMEVKLHAFLTAALDSHLHAPAALPPVPIG